MKIMKKSIVALIICLSVISITSCKKNVLTGDKDLLPATALSMQILENEPIIAADTGYFTVLASTSGAKFMKLSVHRTPDFEGFMEETITQVADSVTVDANGNFSEPVSTILIKYPMVATTKPGDVLLAKFTFTDGKGKTVSASASKIVVNFRTHSKQEFFYASRPWYSFNAGKAYSKASIGNDELKDELEVYFFRKNGIRYFCSPDADEAAAEMTSITAYDQNEVHTTKIIKLEGLTFNDVEDATFAAMNFTEAVDVVELEDKTVYGILLQDGRKAAFETVYYSTIYSRVRSKIQITATP